MKTIYQCEICGSKHDAPEAALACEAQPMRDMKQGNFTDKENAHEPMIGEVVACAYPAMGWWEGDKDWRVYLDRGGNFITGFYHLWVVVAKIPAGDRHVWHYILWTPSNHIGNERLCWTAPTHTVMHPNRAATLNEMRNAQAAFNAVPNPQRIALM